jgi:hypothetical protein
LVRVENCFTASSPVERRAEVRHSSKAVPIREEFPGGSNVECGPVQQMLSGPGELLMIGQSRRISTLTPKGTTLNSILLRSETGYLDLASECKLNMTVREICEPIHAWKDKSLIFLEQR